MAAWAVFDIDGTLLPKISMEREFLKYLFGKHLLPLTNACYYAYKGFTGFLALGWEEAIKTNKAYLRGLQVDRVEEYADACFRERIAPAVVRTGKQKVESLRHEGYMILLISGAPAFMVRRLRPALDPDRVIAAELEIIDNHFTGNIVGPHPFGRRKTAILKAVQKELNIEFSKSVVFANHHSDIDHMKLFARAVAVNPDRKLREFAVKTGWETASWE
jgi:HAD superfamily hydrolase (TIGR01490 family)